MICKKRKHFERSEVLAGLINNPNSVGVAIQCDSNIGTNFPNCLAQWNEIVCDRLRLIHSRKVWILI